MFTKVGNSIWFSATDYSVNREIFITDGTIAGTYQPYITDPSPVSGSSASQYTLVGDLLFFTADSPNEGYELHVAVISYDDNGVSYIENETEIFYE